MDPERTITATESCLTTTIDDEVVILNEATGEYQGLHGIGPFVWDQLQEATTAEAVCAAVADAFDDRPDGWESEVLAFLRALEEQHLIEVVDAPRR